MKPGMRKIKYLFKISALSDGSRNGTLVCLDHEIIISTTKLYCVPFSGRQWCVRCPERVPTHSLNPSKSLPCVNPIR